MTRLPCSFLRDFQKHLRRAHLDFPSGGDKRGLVLSPRTAGASFGRFFQVLVSEMQHGIDVRSVLQR